MCLEVPESVVAQWFITFASVARGPRSDPRFRQGKVQSPNKVSLVSFASGRPSDQVCQALLVSGLPS